MTFSRVLFGSDQLNEYLSINEIKHLMNIFICEWKNQQQEN